MRVAGGIKLTCSFLRGIVPLSGRYILGIAILFVGMGGAFGVISGIFNPFDRSRFQRLIRIGEFLNRLFVRVANVREPLRTHALSSAIDADLRGIIAEFIQLRL